jgi:hypothetical protein
LMLMGSQTKRAPAPGTVKDFAISRPFDDIRRRLSTA